MRADAAAANGVTPSSRPPPGRAHRGTTRQRYGLWSTGSRTADSRSATQPEPEPPRDLDRPPERFPSALPPREPASLSRPHEAVSARPCGDRTPAAPVFGVRLTRSLNESLVEFSGLVGRYSDLPIGRRAYRPGATCPGPLPTGAAGGDPGDRANPASELAMLSARRRPGPASAHPISRSMSTESNAALPHRPANTGSATFNSRVTALAASSRCRAGRRTSSLSAG